MFSYLKICDYVIALLLLENLRWAFSLAQLAAWETKNPAVARENTLQPIQFPLQYGPSRSSGVDNFFMLFKSQYATLAYYITGWTVVQKIKPCVNGDFSFLWGIQKFDPTQNQNTWPDWNKIWHGWLRQRVDSSRKILCKFLQEGLFGKWVK